MVYSNMLVQCGGKRTLHLELDSSVFEFNISAY